MLCFIFQNNQRRTHIFDIPTGTRVLCAFVFVNMLVHISTMQSLLLLPTEAATNRMFANNLFICQCYFIVCASATVCQCYCCAFHCCCICFCSHFFHYYQHCCCVAEPPCYYLFLWFTFRVAIFRYFILIFSIYDFLVLY